MIGFISRRIYHPTRYTLSMMQCSSLSKLRKSTGYSVSNCKKAVDLFPDDFVKAEKWLHEQAKSQGWSKWSKIQQRSAAQGLVGVISRDKIGAMIEVNCETDFVAKNAEFQLLAESILTGSLNEIKNTPMLGVITKHVMDEDQLKSMKVSSSSIGELVNTAMNKFNEKTVAKRALGLKVGEDVHISSLCHPTLSCPTLNGAFLVGKYGTLLAYRMKNNESPDEDLASGICQHIIGMNPLSIGELTEKDVQRFEAKRLQSTEEASIEQIPEQPLQTQSESTTQEAEEETDETLNAKETEETRLLFQPCGLDPTTTVGELLHNAGFEVVCFERFECGERLEKEQPVMAAAVGV